MANSQNVFTPTTLALLMFTIVVGAWFVLTNDMNAVQNELKTVIGEMASVFKNL